MCVSELDSPPPTHTHTLSSSIILKGRGRKLADEKGLKALFARLPRLPEETRDSNSNLQIMSMGNVVGLDPEGDRVRAIFMRSKVAVTHCND